MRISKLFHWLYASIMLMPIFAIGVKSLYVTFNPNSKDSYYGETINDVQYIDKTSFNTNDKLKFTMYNFGSLFNAQVSENTNWIIVSNYHNEYLDYDYLRLGFYSYANTDDLYIIGRDLNSNTIYFNTTVNNSTTFECIYLNGQFSNTDLYTLFKVVLVNDFSYVDNVFYYSVEQISNESLFNWANGTFLAQPLLFITNLFGVPSTSPIITILCYWFAISVIWLVFDVIMYIPLLVHRWLDKGVIE